MCLGEVGRSLLQMSEGLCSHGRRCNFSFLNSSDGMVNILGSQNLGSM